jgi:putative oxidoreductase
MAVISYAHVLLAEGSEAALGQHVLWGFMLLTLMAFGPGRFSTDAWWSTHRAATMTAPLPA